MDCTFITPEGKFNYRVGAIIIHNNKVLMATNKRDNYFYSVGGRVRMHETAEDAVKREVFEETNCNLEIDRLAIIHENFFTLEHNNQKYHEVCFYFYMMVPEDIEIYCSSVNDENIDETMEWLPINELDKFIIHPDFFANELTNSTDNIKHIVTFQN